MKTTLLLLVSLGLSACKREEQRHAVDVAKPQVDYPKHFKAAWVMSSAWWGYMGVAIAITDDRYYYWMYSDVGADRDYPYYGSYSVDEGVLRLGEPTSLISGKNTKSDTWIALYSSDWKLIKTPTTTTLHSIRDKPDDVGRNLILDVQFDPQDPFRNQQSLKPEQVGGCEGEKPHS